MVPLDYLSSKLQRQSQSTSEPHVGPQGAGDRQGRVPDLEGQHGHLVLVVVCPLHAVLQELDSVQQLHLEGAGLPFDRPHHVSFGLQGFGVDPKHVQVQRVGVPRLDELSDGL